MSRRTTARRRGSRPATDGAPPLRRARAQRVVPRGGVGTDLYSPDLLLWTFMPVAAYERLRRDGRLTCDPALLDDEVFTDAYAWMREQFVARRPDAEGTAQLWAWARMTRRSLLDSAADHVGDALVSYRVPRERALLSDFGAWHDVLNRFEHWPPALDDDEVEPLRAAFEAEMDRHGLWGTPTNAWPADLRARVEASWRHIFDVGAHPATNPVQAVVEYIDASEVVDAVLLTGRRRRR